MSSWSRQSWTALLFKLTIVGDLKSYRFLNTYFKIYSHIKCIFSSDFCITSSMLSRLDTKPSANNNICLSLLVAICWVSVLYNTELSLTFWIVVISTDYHLGCSVDIFLIRWFSNLELVLEKNQKQVLNLLKYFFYGLLFGGI